MTACGCDCADKYKSALVRSYTSIEQLRDRALARIKDIEADPQHDEARLNRLNAIANAYDDALAMMKMCAEIYGVSVRG